MNENKKWRLNELDSKSFEVTNKSNLNYKKIIITWIWSVCVNIHTYHVYMKIMQKTFLSSYINLAPQKSKIVEVEVIVKYWILNASLYKVNIKEHNEIFVDT